MNNNDKWDVNGTFHFNSKVSPSDSKWDGRPAANIKWDVSQNDNDKGDVASVTRRVRAHRAI